MDPPSDPNTCCVCRGELKQPTKTLPCLHAACSLCLDRYLMGEVFKCPSCQAPFEPDDIRSAFSESRRKITRALRRQSSGSSGSLPGSIPVVGGIDSTSPRSSDCAGESAPRPRVSSHPHPIPTSSSSSSSSSPPYLPTDFCPSHPRLERSCFCKSCRAVCCPECAFDSHLGHSLERLSAVTRDTGNDAARMADQVAQQSPPHSHPQTTIPEARLSSSPPPPYSIFDISPPFQPSTLECAVQQIDNTPEASSQGVEMDRESNLESSASSWTRIQRNGLANYVDGSFRSTPITVLEEQCTNAAKAIMLKKTLRSMMIGLNMSVDIDEGYRMFVTYIQERKSFEAGQFIDPKVAVFRNLFKSMPRS